MTLYFINQTTSRCKSKNIVHCWWEKLSSTHFSFWWQKLKYSPTHFSFRARTNRKYIIRILLARPQYWSFEDKGQLGLSRFWIQWKSVVGKHLFWFDSHWLWKQTHEYVLINTLYKQSKGMIFFIYSLLVDARNSI